MTYGGHDPAVGMTDVVEITEPLDVVWRRAVARAEGWSSSAAHRCPAIPSADRASRDYHAVVVGPWQRMMIHLLLEVINSCDGDLALVVETVDMSEETVVLLADTYVERSDFFSWSPVVEVVPDRWDRMLAQMLVGTLDACSTYVAAVTLGLAKSVLCARARRARRLLGRTEDDLVFYEIPLESWRCMLARLLIVAVDDMGDRAAEWLDLRPQQLEQLMLGAEAILRNQGRYRSLVTVEVERDTWLWMQMALVLVAVDQMPDLALAAGVLGLSWDDLNRKIGATRTVPGARWEAEMNQRELDAAWLEALGWSRRVARGVASTWAHARFGRWRKTKTR